MRRILIGKAVKYGSTDNSTAGNATSPELLYNGSIGIYGTNTSTGATELITTSSTYSNYEDIMICQGGNSETILLSDFKCADVQSIITQVYVAPTKQVFYV